MDQPLSFSPISTNIEKTVKQKKVDTNINVLNIKAAENNLEKFNQQLLNTSGVQEAIQCYSVKNSNVKNDNQCRLGVVDYDASDSESS